MNYIHIFINVSLYYKINISAKLFLDYFLVPLPPTSYKSIKYCVCRFIDK